MKVNFLIAEEVRPEVNGKMTILGLFAGDIILLVKGARPEGVAADTPVGLERLAILVIIGETEGEHKFKGKLVEPSGELYKSELALGEATLKKGFNHTIIVELKPFIVKQEGIFNFEFFVDDQKFTFPFEIRERNQLNGESTSD